MFDQLGEAVGENVARNPELAQERMKEIYENKGYSKSWIDKMIFNRQFCQFNVIINTKLIVNPVSI